MRRILQAALAVALFLSPTLSSRADDTTKAILEKAIKAHGGIDKVGKERATTTKSKGTLEVMGLSIKFTSESLSSSGKFKESLNLDVMGQNVVQVVGFDGTNVWITTNGTETPLTDKMKEDINKGIKEQLYMGKLARYAFLNDKSVQTSALGEVKVENKPAVGVRISSKDHKDVNVYFDKESGLLVKIEHQTTDVMTGTDVSEERVITEFQEFEGLKVAKKAVITKDGKKFMDLEIEDMKFSDKLDDSLFVKP